MSEQPNLDKPDARTDAQKFEDALSLPLYVRLILIIVIPLLILSSGAFIYVQWVNAKSRAVDNWDPGWRPANGKNYNPTNQR